jgi:hypothetical protein
MKPQPANNTVTTSPPPNEATGKNWEEFSSIHSCHFSVKAGFRAITHQGFSIQYSFLSYYPRRSDVMSPQAGGPNKPEHTYVKSLRWSILLVIRLITFYIPAGTQHDAWNANGVMAARPTGSPPVLGLRLAFIRSAQPSVRVCLCRRSSSVRLRCK